MESITPHPDLMLLQSLSRELQQDIQEALTAGVGPIALVQQLGVDALSLGAYAEHSVEKVEAMLKCIHDNFKDFCACESSLLNGLFLEAFIMGARYRAEKVVWEEAKAALGDRLKPDEPEQP